MLIGSCGRELRRRLRRAGLAACRLPAARIRPTTAPGGGSPRSDTTHCSFGNASLLELARRRRRQLRAGFVEHAEIVGRLERVDEGQAAEIRLANGVLQLERAIGRVDVHQHGADRGPWRTAGSPTPARSWPTRRSDRPARSRAPRARGRPDRRRHRTRPTSSSRADCRRRSHRVWDAAGPFRGAPGRS